jgi:trans-aconitate methyltransferase
VPDWNAPLYLRFERERTQPGRDLLARVTIDEPQAIVDLGCGPGNSTAILRKRWPAAQIVGVDNSPAMLEQAKKTTKKRSGAARTSAHGDHLVGSTSFSRTLLCIGCQTMNRL